MKMTVGEPFYVDDPAAAAKKARDWIQGELWRGCFSNLAFFFFLSQEQGLTSKY